MGINKFNDLPKKNWFLIFGILIIVFGLFHNAWMYEQPIGKIVKIEERIEQEGGTNLDDTYEQSLTIRILNGKYKGHKVRGENQYKESKIDSVSYQKGDQVFLELHVKSDRLQVTIKEIKRDSIFSLLILICGFLLCKVAGKRGVRVVLSVITNLLLFVVALKAYEHGANLWVESQILMILFTTLSLVLANGLNRQTVSAIGTSLLTVLVAMGLFRIVIANTEMPDFASLDYLIPIEDLDEIFLSGIMIAGLGATMDVAISIAAGLQELLIKSPDISRRDLMKSGRTIGYDIMGTMINVLFFTYLSGLFPMILIKLKNEIHILSILKHQIPFEICRFFIGGISIVVAIPISILISSFLLVRKEKKVM